MPWGRGDPKAWGYCCSRAPLSLEAAPCTPYPLPASLTTAVAGEGTGLLWPLDSLGVDLEAGVTDQLLTSVTTDVGAQR